MLSEITKNIAFRNTESFSGLPSLISYYGTHDANNWNSFHQPLELGHIFKMKGWICNSDSTYQKNWFLCKWRINYETQCIYNYRCHRYMYLHAIFQEDWPEKKKRTFFHLKIWCNVSVADCTQYSPFNARVLNTKGKKNLNTRLLDDEANAGEDKLESDKGERERISEKLRKSSANGPHRASKGSLFVRECATVRVLS